MTITLNGDATDMPCGTTVLQLLTTLGLPARGVALAVDGVVVPRSAWADTVLPDQSRVEVVTAMQGG